MPAPALSSEQSGTEQFLRQLRESALERAGIDVRFLAGMPALRRKTAELEAAPANERLSVITRFGPRAAHPTGLANVTRIIVPPDITTGQSLDHLMALCEQGAHVRVSARAVRRLTVVNRAVALVDISGLHGRSESEAVRINNSDLIRLVVGHFDQLWRSAVPLTSGSPVTLDRFTERQRRVLELLAEGMTDEQVSRDLGLSSRSVRSEVAAIRQVLGAQSRFEAGMKYAALLQN